MTLGNTASPRRRSASGAAAISARLAVLVAATALTSCTLSDNPNDPFERYNRDMFEINEGIDAVIIRPLTRTYVALVPEFVRMPVGRFFDNLAYPHVIVNDVLQGRFEQGWDDFWRFAVNSTIGIGGLFDPATEMGLEAHDQNFAATAGVWGLPQGPYLVLPVLGPTTVAGLPDIPLRIISNPLFYFGASPTRTFIRGVGGLQESADARTELEVVRDAVNPYVFLRESYLQWVDRIIAGEQGRADPFAELPLPGDAVGDDLQGSATTQVPEDP